MDTVAQLLSQSLQLGPQRKQAEQQLQQGESQPGFLLILLQLVGQETAPNEIRLAAAVLLKNNIRKNWVGKVCEKKSLLTDPNSQKTHLSASKIEIQ